MTLDREAEQRRLNEADRHIIEAERRLTAQSSLIEKLRVDGHDTFEAEKLLVSLSEILSNMRMHRKTITDVLGNIDAGRI